MASKLVAQDVWARFAIAPRHLKMQLGMPQDLHKCLTRHWLAATVFKNELNVLPVYVLLLILLCAFLPFWELQSFFILVPGYYVTKLYFDIYHKVIYIKYVAL